MVEELFTYYGDYALLKLGPTAPSLQMQQRLVAAGSLTFFYFQYFGRGTAPISPLMIAATARGFALDIERGVCAGLEVLADPELVETFVQPSVARALRLWPAQHTDPFPTSEPDWMTVQEAFDYNVSLLHGSRSTSESVPGMEDPHGA
jgi:hypothetical protein